MTRRRGVGARDLLDEPWCADLARSLLAEPPALASHIGAAAGRNRRRIRSRRVDTSTTPNTASIVTACAA
jgi:hypothetical protein